MPSADPKTADLTHYEWKTGDEINGGQEKILLASALSSDSESEANLALHNGDVLAIRQNVPAGAIWERR